MAVVCEDQSRLLLTWTPRYWNESTISMSKPWMFVAASVWVLRRKSRLWIWKLVSLQDTSHTGTSGRICLYVFWACAKQSPSRPSNWSHVVAFSPCEMVERGGGVSSPSRTHTLTAPRKQFWLCHCFPQRSVEDGAKLLRCEWAAGGGQGGTRLWLHAVWEVYMVCELYMLQVIPLQLLNGGP